MTGCTDWIDISEHESPHAMQHAPDIVKEAQVLMKQRGDFSLLNMNLRSDKDVAQAKRETTFAKALKIRWDKYHLFYDRGQEGVVIPIEGYTLTALSVLNKEGRVKHTKNKVSAKLIVRRENDNTLTTIIGTYVYDQNYARENHRELDTLAYDFEDSRFTGYFITSHLNGKFILGRNLKKGKEAFAFILNQNPKEHHCEQDIHLYLGINTQAPITRSTFTEQETRPNDHCESCDRPKSDCGCAVVIGCKTCKQTIQNGTCACDNERCSTCNYRKKECDCCKTCNRPRNICICHAYQVNPPSDGSQDGSDNNNTGGTGRGDSGGTGNGGNISGSTNDGKGGGQQKPPPSPYKLNTPYTLSQAQVQSTTASVVNQMTAKYGSSLAVCNFGVQTAFKALFPNQSPPGMSGRANEMVKAWGANPHKWEKITIDQAQAYANAGLFVVAGWVNPNPNESGHVVVIVPGQAKIHKSSNQPMPRTMDTGGNKRGTHYYLYDSFGKSKLPHVVFYYYKN